MSSKSAHRCVAWLTFESAVRLENLLKFRGEDACESIHTLLLVLAADLYFTITVDLTDLIVVNSENVLELIDRVLLKVSHPEDAGYPSEDSCWRARAARQGSGGLAAHPSVCVLWKEREVKLLDLRSNGFLI